MPKKKIMICVSGGGAIQLESATGVFMALDTLGVLKRAGREYRACSGGAPVAALHCSGFRGTEIAQLIRNTPMKELVYHPFLGRYFDASGVWDLLLSHMPKEPLTNCRVAVTRIETAPHKQPDGTVERSFAAMWSCMVDATPSTVVASMSIPGVFRPVKIQNDLYTDGGVKNLIPTPAIDEINDYAHIYIILSPVKKTVPKNDWSLINWFFGTELKSAAGLLDREITQIYEDGWHKLSNVTVIRPDVPEKLCGRSLISEMLEWSEGNAMIDRAFQFTLELLGGKENERTNNKLC